MVMLSIFGRRRLKKAVKHLEQQKRLEDALDRADMKTLAVYAGVSYKFMDENIELLIRLLEENNYIEILKISVKDFNFDDFYSVYSSIGNNKDKEILMEAIKNETGASSVVSDAVKKKVQNFK